MSVSVQIIHYAKEKTAGFDRLQFLAAQQKRNNSTFSRTIWMLHNIGVGEGAAFEPKAKNVFS